MTEIEIQLMARRRLTLDEVWAAAQPWRPRRLPERQLAATYYAAPDLTARRYVLRARREDDALVAALKGPGPVVDGVATRLEIEAPLERMPAVGDPLPAPFVAALQHEHHARTTWPAPGHGNRVRRAVAEVQLPGHAELVVDRGELFAGDRTAAIDEVELESTGASPRELARAAVALAEALELRPSGLSKGARGLCLQGALGAPSDEPWAALLEVEERIRLGEARRDRDARWAAVFGGTSPPLDSDEHAGAIHARWRQQLGV